MYNLFPISLQFYTTSQSFWNTKPPQGTAAPTLPGLEKQCLLLALNCVLSFGLSVLLSLSVAHSPAEVLWNKGSRVSVGACFGFLLLHTTGMRTDQHLWNTDEANSKRDCTNTEPHSKNILLLPCLSCPGDGGATSNFSREVKMKWES